MRLVAYQTAYLKANYPVEFLAASMTYDMGNTDKLNVFRQELDRLGVPLLPPDINASLPVFSVETQADGSTAIRYALAAVKNVGAAAMASLVVEREANGPFKDLTDLAMRLDPRAINKRQLESLACAGAFSSLEQNRRQVFEGAELLVRQAAAAAAERESSQVSLFGGEGAGPAPAIALPEVEDWPGMERLHHEFGAIGFYLSAHPLDTYAAVLERLKVLRSADLAGLTSANLGRRKLAGIVVGKQERTSRQGNRFAFVQLSDTSGMFEVMVFSELLGRVRELLDGGQPLLVTASVEVRNDGEAPRLTAQEIEVLDQAVAQTSSELKLFLHDPAPLESLKAVLGREAAPSARGRIALVLDLDGGQEVELELPGGYPLSAKLRQAIKAIPGIAVQEL